MSRKIRITRNGVCFLMCIRMLNPPVPIVPPTQPLQSPPNVNVHLLSNNNSRQNDPVYEYIKRQMTINQLGLNDLVVLQPPDVNPVLRRRYDIVGSETDTETDSDSPRESRTRDSRSRHNNRNRRVPLRKYRR